jgi:hypothetical protein
MDTLMQRTWAYFWLPETKYVIAAAVMLTLITLPLLAKERRRAVATFLAFVLCLVGQLVGALFEALDYSRFAVMVHELFVIGSGLALVRLLAMLRLPGDSATAGHRRRAHRRGHQRPPASTQRSFWRDCTSSALTRRAC